MRAVTNFWAYLGGDGALAKLSIDQALLKAKSHAKKGEIEEARQLYQSVLQAFPQNVRAQQGLAALSKPRQNDVPQAVPQEVIDRLVALYSQGQLSAVVEQAQTLTEQYPRAFFVWNVLGATNKGLGRTEDAASAFKRVTELNPTYADGFNNLGVTLQEQGKLDEAIAAYNKALSIKPDYAEAYNNMGNALKEQGKLDEAIAAYNKALSIKPDYAEAYYNMGNALKEQGKLDEAIAAYNKALSIKPDYAAVGAQCLYQLAHICDWSAIEGDQCYLSELGVKGEAVSPFSLLSLEDAPGRHRLRSETYAQKNYPQKAMALSIKPVEKPKRLRIGYFSTNLNEHPVAYLIAKVLERHNRDEFEVFGYSLHGNEQSELRQRLIKSFDCFTDVQGLGDKDVALRARQDNIDIAIDLNGYTTNARPGVFAYRAAPIQINYLGYPGTLGADFMDYVIADKNLIPEIYQKHYSEKKIYLPNQYQAQDDKMEIATNIPSRSSLGLPEQGFVFCAINNTYKITPREFDIWMRLLQKVAGSALWLYESNSWVKENLLKEASARGIAHERLVFSKKVAHDKYLAQFRQADLYLDTFNYNAGATASNALWAGLPVLTKQGKSYTARMASSLLAAIGLPELITESEEEYEALAFTLATDPNQLTHIKSKLEANRLTQPLFDSEMFTRHLEKGYEMAYERYVNGQAPDNIVVPK
jgi:predicted O-linked N-acetylglucosamine transferase (SPINDLY family)